MQIRAVIGILAGLGVPAATSWSAQLGDEDIASGRIPAFGDTIILSDFARCEPSTALSESSQKGKWWLRPHTTEKGSGRILCVEQRDMDDPESCIAPALTYPLDLKGAYDIWVAVYRPVFGGGIDIKLTTDRTYTHMDPWEEAHNDWTPPAKVGNLVECFYKTAKLRGQDIHLRQPHGTYQSFWWGLCNAHVAYVKLVRRWPREVRGQQERLEGLQRKGVVIDRDGFSHLWNWGVEDIDCVLGQVEQMQYGNVEAVNWCIGGSMATNFPHPMTGRIVTHNRLGDRRATRVHQSFIDRGIDILQVLVERCREIGIKIYASHRANVHYYPSKAWDEHPDWRLKNSRGLDYANPSARGYYRDMLLYIAEHYDIDGLTIDFTRHRRHFNPGQEDEFGHMNTYLRELRAGLDEIGAKKGRRLVLNASFTAGVWYDSWTPAQQGLDVHTWVEEGFVDCIMPVGRDHMKYINMCAGKATKCYPRVTYQSTFDGNAAGKNIHDPTPNEDKKDRPDNFHLGPWDYIKGVKAWYDAGADGVMLFNLPDAWTTLRPLPYPGLLAEQMQSKDLYGRREGPAVTWQ